jgi:hypothetical protein
MPLILAGADSPKMLETPAPQAGGMIDEAKIVGAPVPSVIALRSWRSPGLQAGAGHGTTENGLGEYRRTSVLLPGSPLPGAPRLKSKIVASPPPLLWGDRVTVRQGLSGAYLPELGPLEN